MEIVITPQPVMIITRKFDKKNTAMSKKFDGDFMSANCDVIFFFSDL